ncbi:hypothetical protein FLA_5866 [Filimonas lacunae]|nr:hypothetical protein FLA_5866 [Filimonas lacunae]
MAGAYRHSCSMLVRFACACCAVEITYGKDAAMYNSVVSAYF